MNLQVDVTINSPLPESHSPIKIVRVKAAKHAGSEWPLYLYEINGNDVSSSHDDELQEDKGE